MTEYDDRPRQRTQALSETERDFIAALARWSANADFEKATVDWAPAFGARFKKAEGIDIIELAVEAYDGRDRDST